MPFGIILTMLLFPITGVVIFLYLRSSFRLLDRVRTDAPEVWERLGRPEKTYVQQQRGGFSTIQPIGPWLSWIAGGDTRGLPLEVADLYQRVRQLLGAGLTLFGLTVGCMLWGMSVAS